MGKSFLPPSPPYPESDVTTSHRSGSPSRRLPHSESVTSPRTDSTRTVYSCPKVSLVFVLEVTPTATTVNLLFPGTLFGKLFPLTIGSLRTVGVLDYLYCWSLTSLFDRRVQSGKSVPRLLDGLCPTKSFFSPN